MVQYLLFINKYAFLKPDVYIVCIYTGNDFLDASSILEAKEGILERPAGYLRSLRNCNLNDGAISQIMNQIYYFKTFPKMKGKVVKYVLELILEIKTYCKKRNIDLIVAFLPSKADVEWESDAEALVKVKNCLKISAADLRVNRELTQELARGARINNINFIDLYTFMKDGQEELYWKRDYHLSDQGHKLVAEKMYEQYRGYFVRDED